MKGPATDQATVGTSHISANIKPSTARAGCGGMPSHTTEESSTMLELIIDINYSEILSSTLVDIAMKAGARPRWNFFKGRVKS